MEHDKVYPGVKTCRLFDNEADYLNNHYEGKFSNYIHDSFKRDIMNTKTNKKQNILSRFSGHFIMLGLGAIFVLFSLSVNNLASFLLIFLMGVFFTITGLFNIFLELKKINELEK